MVEFAFIAALIIVAHRLRRAARQPQPPLEVHVFHQFPGDPGERESPEMTLADKGQTHLCSLGVRVITLRTVSSLQVALSTAAISKKGADHHCEK